MAKPSWIDSGPDVTYNSAPKVPSVNAATRNAIHNSPSTIGTGAVQPTANLQAKPAVPAQAATPPVPSQTVKSPKAEPLSAPKLQSKPPSTDLLPGSTSPLSADVSRFQAAADQGLISRSSSGIQFTPNALGRLGQAGLVGLDILENSSPPAIAASGIANAGLYALDRNTSNRLATEGIQRSYAQNFMNNLFHSPADNFGQAIDNATTATINKNRQAAREKQLDAAIAQRHQLEQAQTETAVRSGQATQQQLADFSIRQQRHKANSRSMFGLW